MAGALTRFARRVATVRRTLRMPLLLGALAYLAFGLALPFLLFHPKLKEGVRDRLGLHPAGWPPLAADRPRVWIHGASAGDVLALMPLVRELRALRPDVQVIASTITNSGRAIIERESREFAAVTYLPYDLPGAVKRTLERIRPDVLVLEYTELWPHLIRAAAARGVKVVLHNGRFSPENLGRYRTLFALTGNLLNRMRLLLMRDDSEAERARQLGASPEAVHVTGNTKFDNLVRDPNPEKLAELRRVVALPAGARLWVAGSTHEGEEELLLDVFVALRKKHPELVLLVAPRYTERGERVKGLAKRAGLRVRLRSESSGGAADVIVLDTIGELAACYAMADLVFVGGSFVERGGQNILEPAACGRPVLFGPHMQNFADSVQVLLGRGGIQAASKEQLERVMLDLLARPDHCRELGELAREQVSRVRGAATRNAELIARLFAS
jgi:3-deoxy-D-manno-octulosonic-acid transferase